MTVFTAIFIAAFAAIANAATYPQTAEIDLVFPHNATYAPTDLLPIVIAVQNPTLAAVLQPVFDVEVWHFRTNDQPSSIPIIDFPAVNSSQSDPLLLYSYVANLTAGLYTLDLGVRIGNCSEDGSLPTTYNDTGFAMVFTIADGGQAVDLDSASAANVCASASSLTWNVTDTPKATNGDLTSNISTCAVLSEEKPWPAANPCAATVDAAAAASISATLESWTCSSNCTSSDNKSEGAGALWAGTLPTAIWVSVWLVAAQFM